MLSLSRSLARRAPKAVARRHLGVFKRNFSGDSFMSLVMSCFPGSTVAVPVVTGLYFLGGITQVDAWAG